MTELHIQPFDSSVLIDIYLDGMATGAATTARDVAKVPTEVADRYADDMIRQVQGDPIVMETLRREIFDRVRGVDNGPFDITVHAVPKEK